MISILMRWIVIIIGIFIVLTRLGFDAVYKNLIKIIPNSLTVKSSKTYNILIHPGLSLGSSGQEVNILQSALSTDKNIYPSGIVSGYYGNLTKQAVINFQNKNHLAESGEINQASAKKFNEIYGFKDKEFYLNLYPTQSIKVNLPNDELNQNFDEWGKAKQVSEHGWTMNVGYDTKMATSQEIFNALNSYRQKHGRNSLSWDDRLASYASQRAQYFTQIGNLDEHAGFNEYLKNEENIKKLGFWWLGENSSFGYRLEGTHLIEWIYAGDQPHNDNQLSSDWTHVGIGVDGYQTDLIFGGHQM